MSPGWFRKLRIFLFSNLVLLKQNDIYISMLLFINFFLLNFICFFDYIYYYVCLFARLFAYFSFVVSFFLFDRP